MSQSFTNLCSPGQIGSMTLKNRMVVAAMGVNMGDDGHCGDQIVAFHERQAQGGVGLIVVGSMGVGWPSGSNQPRQVAISDDRFIPGLARLATAVQAHGTKIVAQLHHGGLVAAQDSKEGRPLWVPSYPVHKAGNLFDGMLEEELAAFVNPDAPKPSLHVMEEGDIATLVAWFAAAAGRAQAAGFDGVEIHGGHGYIISEFLSPATNKRSDSYGGSLQNRARLLLEIIAAVRATVGGSYPVWCKLDSAEFGKAEGISLADARETARLAEAAGCDAIAVSAYHDTSQGGLHSESNIPHVPNRLVANAAAIKQVLRVPVITAGRIEVKDAEKHLRQQQYDFLGMGRKLLADPDLPRKLAADTPEQVRPCVYCYCCASQIYVLQHVKCAVNPETGFERERGLLASDRSRHIAVIGGGPAGMELSRRLDAAGHRVTLFEAGPRLGGTLQFASIAYAPNTRLLRWLRLQVENSGVQLQLETRVTPQLLQQLAPDEVVVATGAMRELPDIPGADQEFVFSGDEMRALVMSEPHPGLALKTTAFTRLMTWLGSATGATAVPELVQWASRAWMPLGKRVGIIGSELVGLELAEFLAERGREVTVVDEARRPGAGLYLVRRLRLLEELEHLGVQIVRGAGDIAIEGQSMAYTNYRGQRRCIEVDQIVVAKGATGDTRLADSLSAAGFKTHSIGDCTGVSYIEGAMEAAAELARQLA